MTGLLKRFIAVFFRRIVGRHYLLISALSVLLSALSVWVIASQWNINSDFKALLPRTSDAYKAMEEVGDRVGSGSALFVVIDSPDAEANKRFAKAYADELRSLPQVALAHYHNDKSFFKKHQLLYLQEGDLKELHDRLEEKIRDAKKKANPFFVSLAKPDEDQDDELFDKAQMEEKYKGLAHQDHKEYLVSDDGYSMTLVVRFVETSTDLEATNKLLDKVREVGQSLEPTTYHAEMGLEYGGGLVNRQEEYSSILDDVQSSALFTLVGLLLVIGLYFRRIRAVLFVLAPLIMGVLWTLAAGFLIFGELTTITVFIFAILLGLSIDFSIHLLSGYDLARSEGRDPVNALIRCYSTTGKATVIGAFTTFVTFVVLSFAQFRGLSQFGQVASIGVICTLFAMLVVLPAIILAVHRLAPFDPPTPGDASSTPESSNGHDTTWFDTAKLRPFGPLFLLVAVGLTTFAVIQLPTLGFEENFRNVGQIQWPWVEGEAQQIDQQKASPEDHANAHAIGVARQIAEQAEEVRERVQLDTYVRDREQNSTGDKWTSAVGDQSSTPTVLLFDDADKAAQVYRFMDARLKDGQLETVRSIGSVHAFVPASIEEQNKRLAQIRRIDGLLNDSDLSVMSKKERKRIEDLQGKLGVETVSAKDLPVWTKRLFKESGPQAKKPDEGQEYAYEYLIYVNSAVSSMVGSDARHFLGQLQDVREQSGVDFRIGSQAYIYTAMLEEIQTDGALMMSIALVIVLLLLMLAFRHVLRGMVAMTPLVLGALWMFGIAAFLGLKLDFFNVIILPVIVGIGVDDGVHFYYHYREEGRGSTGHTLRHVGAAIVMTSITSMIGFGGLAVTDYDGLQSIGYLAIIGIATTLVATLLVLPPILWLGEKYDIHWLVGE
jgi:predicted RND superfamily exporter protein